MSRLMPQQKRRLFELLEDNYDIWSGDSCLGNAEKIAIWEVIKDVLNEMGPPKTTEQWKRVWTDLRKILKKKISLRKAYEMRGDRIPCDLVFTETDLWAIRICKMDAFEKQPVKIKKQELIDLEDSCSQSSRLTEVQPERSSKRVYDRKNQDKQPQFDELIDDKSLISLVVSFSDDEATQSSEGGSNLSPPQKKPRKNSRNEIVGSEENYVLVPAEDKGQLKQLICLQQQQLAVTRQIHERQKCHHIDQRQFNVRVTNLLQEILQQLKTNQPKK